ncbi:MAG TPA: protein phosphatase 2C domain-containing protein [Rhodopila sp.]|jgi:protein phosphatase/serine/threonine-protein phosphatase Stp1|nr:protein phosphatase 2C domain-containing protein [Rhodopila sp.]
MQRFRSRAVTHPGTRRGHNEDAFVARPELGLWAVADGAGGHQAGEIASEMIATALQTIPGALTAEEMLTQVRMRISATHTALKASAARMGQGATIASTVVVLIVRHGYFACLWAGDSRAYLLRDGVLQRLTRDHSLVQELVDAGDLAEHEAERHPHANIITRAVGDPAETVELDKVTGQLAAGDRFLLCSDGLSKTLDDATLGQVLCSSDPEAAADNLLATALARQAADNVTAVVMEVAGDGHA